MPTDLGRHEMSEPFSGLQGRGDCLKSKRVLYEPRSTIKSSNKY